MPRTAEQRHDKKWNFYYKKVFKSDDPNKLFDYLKKTYSAILAPLEMFFATDQEVKITIFFDPEESFNLTFLFFQLANITANSRFSKAHQIFLKLFYNEIKINDSSEFEECIRLIDDDLYLVFLDFIVKGLNDFSLKDERALIRILDEISLKYEAKQQHFELVMSIFQKSKYNLSNKLSEEFIIKFLEFINRVTIGNAHSEPKLVEICRWFDQKITRIYSKMPIRDKLFELCLDANKRFCPGVVLVRCLIGDFEELCRFIDSKQFTRKNNEAIQMFSKFNCPNLIRYQLRRHGRVGLILFYFSLSSHLSNTRSSFLKKIRAVDTNLRTLTENQVFSKAEIEEIVSFSNSFPRNQKVQFETVDAGNSQFRIVFSKRHSPIKGPKESKNANARTSYLNLSEKKMTTRKNTRLNFSHSGTQGHIQSEKTTPRTSLKSPQPTKETVANKLLSILTAIRGKAKQALHTASLDIEIVAEQLENEVKRLLQVKLESEANILRLNESQAQMEEIKRAFDEEKRAKAKMSSANADLTRKGEDQSKVIESLNEELKESRVRESRLEREAQERAQESKRQIESKEETLRQRTTEFEDAIEKKRVSQAEMQRGLESRIEEMSREQSRTQAEWESQKSAFEREIEDLGAKLEKAEEEVREETERAKEMEMSIKRSEENATELKDVILDLNIKIMNFEKEKNSKAKEKTKEEDALIKENEALHESVKKLNDDLSRAEEALKKEISEKMEMKLKMEDSAKEAEQERAEKARFGVKMREQMQKTELQRQEMKTRSDDLTEINLNLRQKMRQVDRVRDKIEELKSQLGEFKAEIPFKVQTLFENTRIVCANQIKKNKKVLSEKRQLNETVSAKDRLIQKANTRIASLQSKNEDLERRCKKLSQSSSNRPRRRVGKNLAFDSDSEKARARPSRVGIQSRRSQSKHALLDEARVVNVIQKYLGSKRDWTKNRASETESVYEIDSEKSDRDPGFLLSGGSEVKVAELSSRILVSNLESAQKDSHNDAKAQKIYIDLLEKAISFLDQVLSRLLEEEKKGVQMDAKAKVSSKSEYSSTD